MTMMKKYPVLIKEDPLEFFISHHKTLFSHKIFTPLIYILCSVGLLFTIISAVSLMSGGFPDFLKNDSFSFFVSSYVTSTLAFEYYYLVGSKVDKYVRRELYWGIGTASVSLQKEIHKRIRVVYSIYVVFVILSSTIALFGFLIELFTESLLFSDVHFIEKILVGYQSLKFLLKWALHFSHFLGTVLCISIYLMLKYCVMTLKMQLDLLSDFLSQVEMYNSSEDMNIKEHLKICTIHHIFISRFLRAMQEQTNFSITTLTPSGTLGVLGCLIFIYYSKRLVEILYVSLVLLLGFLLVIDICWSGQDVQDAFEEFANNLIKIKWYDWNETNKKSLLLMITRTQRSAALAAFSVEVNRALIIRIARVVYQIFLLIKQTI